MRFEINNDTKQREANEHLLAAINCFPDKPYKQAFIALFAEILNSGSKGQIEGFLYDSRLIMQRLEHGRSLSTFLWN